MLRVDGGDLLERLATTDRLHGDPGIEPGAMGAAFANRWEPPFGGGAPPHRLTMDAVLKSQTTSVRGKAGTGERVEVLPSLTSVRSCPSRWAIDNIAIA